MASILFGRAVDPPLDANGVHQARQLAQRLRGLDPQRTLIEASPRLRTRQTAAAIAERLLRPVIIEQALDEVDFGHWAGQSFADLAGDQQWRRWNEQRSSERTPSGDSIAVVRTRLLSHLEELRTDRAERTAVLVTHAEIVRALLLHFLDIPVDEFQRIQVDPASVSVLDYCDGRYRADPHDARVVA